LFRGAFFISEGTQEERHYFSQTADPPVAGHQCLIPTIVRRSAMFDKTLKSLVLRDVSVRCDGTVAGVRLGFGYLAESQPREVPFSSMRHSERCAVGSEPEGVRPRGSCVTSVDNPVALRAGRSVRLARVLHRRTPTTTVGGATGLAWRSRQVRGAVPTAATEGRIRIPPCTVASVGKMSSAASIPADRLCPTTFGSTCQSLQQSWSKQAGRTPGSRWGQVS